MVYKLRFNIVYQNAEKDLIRDMKIDSIISDDIMEIVSEHPISIPDRRDSVTIGESKYFIIGINHKIEKEAYVIVIDIESKYQRDKISEEEAIFQSLRSRKIWK